MAKSKKSCKKFNYNSPFVIFSGFILISLIVIPVSQELFLYRHAKFTVGITKGIEPGSKGSSYLSYEYKHEGILYKSQQSVLFNTVKKIRKRKDGSYLVLYSSLFPSYSQILPLKTDSPLGTNLDYLYTVEDLKKKGILLSPLGLKYTSWLYFY